MANRRWVAVSGGCRQSPMPQSHAAPLRAAGALATDPGDNTFTLLCGTPASGKTTWLRQMAGAAGEIFRWPEKGTDWLDALGPEALRAVATMKEPARRKVRTRFLAACATQSGSPGRKCAPGSVPTACWRTTPIRWPLRCPLPVRQSPIIWPPMTVAAEDFPRGILRGIDAGGSIGKPSGATPDASAGPACEANPCEGKHRLAGSIVHNHAWAVSAKLLFRSTPR